MGKIIPKEEFIRRSKEKYGDAFDYFPLIYTDISSPITILCNRCGKKVHAYSGAKHLEGLGGCACRRYKYWDLKIRNLQKCSLCGEIKSIKHFYKRSEFNADKTLRYMSRCKTCYNNKSEEIKKKRLNSSRIRRVKNKLKLREYYRLREYKYNPKRRLHKAIRSLVAYSLHRITNKKKTHTWPSYLGYDDKILMDHLESRFTEGMNWNNYGDKGWVIDHIIPINAFRKNKKLDYIKKLWSLNNLRPLWFRDNSGKRDKFCEEAKPILNEYSIYLTNKYLKEAACH